MVCLPTTNKYIHGTSGLIVIVLLTIPHHRRYIVSGKRTASKHSGVEEDLGGKKCHSLTHTRTLVIPYSQLRPVV